MGGEQGQLRDRPRLAWWVVGLIFGIVTLFVFYTFIGTFALGLFMYYATRPIYDRLESRLGHPGVTAILSLLAIAFPILVLVAYAVAVSAMEVAEIAGGSVEGYEGILRPYLDLSSLTVHPHRIIELARESQDAFVRLGGPELLGGIVTAASTFGLTLLQLFVALALAFYLLWDDDKLVRWFVRDIGGKRSTVYSYGSAVDSNLQTVYFGSILQAFIVALAAGVVYNLADFVAPPGLSIPLPTLLGLLTGVASLIPHVGTKLVYVPIAVSLVIRAFEQGITLLWFPLVFVVVVVLVLDVVTEAVIRPYTAGRNLHVGLMSFAYIFGPLLFGWYGLFVGPLLLVLLVQFNRIVLPELMRGEPLPVRQLTDDIESVPEAEGQEEQDETSEDSTSQAAERSQPEGDEETGN